MKSVSLWTTIMLPNGTMRPSDRIHGKEMNLTTYYDYKISAVFEWCSEELGNRFERSLSK
jgi:hypothetical protein